MARHALGPARLRLVNAVSASVADTDRSLLVACSGGADSLALADASLIVVRRAGLALAAAVVDHGLQVDSARVAARAVAALKRMGVPTVVLLPVGVVDHGTGPEAAARSARYAVLLEEADRLGATTVLLGHTRDDQAETVLLGLARGSGVRSLAGMAPRRGRFLRPLLGCSRADTAAACAEAGLEPWQDPHNLDPTYARSRVRHTVLPVLEAELGPGIAKALARTAELARDDADLLDELAREAGTAAAVGGDTLNSRGSDRRNSDGGGLDREGSDGGDSDGGALDYRALAALPRPIRRRVLLRWLEQRGARDVALVHLAAVDALVMDFHGQGPVNVPGLAVSRRAGLLVADQPAPQMPVDPPESGIPVDPTA